MNESNLRVEEALGPWWCVLKHAAQPAHVWGFYMTLHVEVPSLQLPASVMLFLESHQCLSSFDRMSEILPRVNTTSLSHLPHIYLNISAKLFQKL